MNISMSDCSDTVSRGGGCVDEGYFPVDEPCWSPTASRHTAVKKPWATCTSVNYTPSVSACASCEKNTMRCNSILTMNTYHDFGRLTNKSVPVSV